MTVWCVTLLVNAPLDGLAVNFWSPGAGVTAWPLLVLFLWGTILELLVTQLADFFSFSFIQLTFSAYFICFLFYLSLL